MAIKKTAREKKNEFHQKAIQSAAITLFNDFGFEKTTVDDICNKVAISKSTFYNLYKSKDDLLMISTNRSRGQYIEKHFHYDRSIHIHTLFRQFFQVNFDYTLLSDRAEIRQVYKGYLSTGNLIHDMNHPYFVELYRLIDRGLAENALRGNMAREDYWRMMTDTMIGCFIGWCTHITEEAGLNERYSRILDELVNCFVIDNSPNNSQAVSRNH